MASLLFFKPQGLDLQIVPGLLDLDAGFLFKGDVPRDRGSGDDLPGAVLDRRDRQGHIDDSSVLSDARGLKMIDRQPVSDPPDNVAKFPRFFFGDQSE